MPAERYTFGIGPVVGAAVLLARRFKLFRQHYAIARGYTGRRNAARIAWGWAMLLRAPGVGTPDGGPGNG
jgi:hypothetical protein